MAEKKPKAITFYPSAEIRAWYDSLPTYEGTRVINYLLTKALNSQYSELDVHKELLHRTLNESSLRAKLEQLDTALADIRLALSMPASSEETGKIKIPINPIELELINKVLAGKLAKTPENKIFIETVLAKINQSLAESQGAEEREEENS
jgi:hypothetical protein